jgi:hypothetical protein
MNPHPDVQLRAAPAIPKAMRLQSAQMDEAVWTHIYYHDGRASANRLAGHIVQKRQLEDYAISFKISW